MNSGTRRARGWARVRTFVFFGLMLGTLAGALTQAPAAWLAQGISSLSDQRVLLADARGTVWEGSAVVVLTAGPGARDAAALPGRLRWTLAWKGQALELVAQQACCLPDGMRLRIVPGLGRLRIESPAPAGVAPLGQWPAAWLAGLGTPWNTLQLGGVVRLASPGFVAEWDQGRWQLQGRADVELAQVSSRLSTLPVLGSYRIGLAAEGDGPLRVTLETLSGDLQLNGSGEWSRQLRFRGQARAAEGAEAALGNLLNIIGRRQGALSIIAIG